MKLDTIILSTHTDYITEHNKRYFNYSTTLKPNGLKIGNYSLATNSFGFEKVCVNDTFNQVNIKINSKILKENYHQGICLETLDQVIYEMAKEGLQLNPNFLYDSKIKMIHITDDISVSKPTSEYLNSLGHLIAPKFIKTSYDEGIVFKERIANEKLYITLYDKECQIKQDRRFFKAFPGQLEYFRNSIRMESKLSSSKAIGKYVKATSLPEILELESPNLFFLNTGQTH